MIIKVITTPAGLNFPIYTPVLMAEGVGFEPTNPDGLTVFKTVAFVHSAIPPRFGHDNWQVIRDCAPQAAIGPTLYCIVARPLVAMLEPG